MPVPATSAKPVRLFFDQATDEQFLVLAEVLASSAPDSSSAVLLSTFLHEDRFLERVIAADLTLADTSQIAARVLQTVAYPDRPKGWIEIELDESQRYALGLHEEKATTPQAASPLEERIGSGLAFDFMENMAQFHDFLMKAPASFVLLSGPEHRLTFINERYLDLIGETDAQNILMKPVRLALPELEGQPFFQLLDEVYRTGRTYIGNEVRAHVRRKDSPVIEDRYFDFIYYPYRDKAGEVAGVMVQTTEVTERVESRHVTEDREDQMFRQWAELDSIYRAAPIAMALIDAKSLRLLRLNELHAEMMGSTIPELLGRNVLKVAAGAPELAKLFEGLAAGEAVRNAIFEREPKDGLSRHRRWLINISPFFGAAGEVIAYTSISLELPNDPPTQATSSQLSEVAFAP